MTNLKSRKNMNTDITCPICSKSTVGLSPILKISETNKFSWENDSTMKLLGWRKVEVQLRFCIKCFHSTIFPKFDSAYLYGEKGSQIRKEIFESYFPNKEYGYKEKKLDLCKDFSYMSQDFLRFHQVTAFVAKFTNITFKETKEIRILDWGGGDGYISSIYACILSIITGLPSRNFIFEYTNWGNVESNKVGKEDLNNMEQFHIIIFSHILEHTHDPVNTIKSALPFLKDKGLVICEIPDERINIIRAILRKRFGLNYHVSYFSRRSLYRVLEQSGLSNINTIYQNDSSYRGRKSSSIAGVAQIGNNLSKRKSAPNIVGETVSLAFFTAKKVAFRILSHITISVSCRRER
jgi:hypothetical protein